MPYTNPIPTTNQARPKSWKEQGITTVKVLVSGTVDYTAGDLVRVGNYLGVIKEDLALTSPANGYAVLHIEPAIYSTIQIAAETFAAGDKLYWDAENKVLTKTVGTIFAGYAMGAKSADSTPVLQFLLVPYEVTFGIEDLATVISDLNTLEETVNGTGGVVETLATYENVLGGAHQADVANVAGADAAALVTDINKAGGIVARINAILAALEAAGILLEA